MASGRLGVMLLVGSLAVLFSCFISAYLVLRMAAPMWPPAGAPALRIGLSAVSTAVLLASAVIAFMGGQRRAFLGATFLLGVLFLALQGVEFQRLYARGLTLQTGAYGAVFYALVGCHGLHVLGGLVGYGIALGRPARADTARIYWTFVTAVWLVLFSILYIL